MALVDLTIQAMLALSKAWIDPNGTRSLLEAIPLAAALLPKLEDAHEELAGTQSDNDAGGERLLTLVDAASETDGLHDRKVRGIYGLLTAMADLADQPIDVARYIDLRDALFPHGLETADLSYNDEADSAANVDARLSTSQRQLLERLPLPWGNLFDEVEQWREAGQRLGEIESQWRMLKGQARASDNSEDASDLLHARHHWIRTAQALEHVLELEDLPHEVRGAILGPLQEAEALASSAAERSLDEANEDAAEPDEAEVAEVEASLGADDEPADEPEG